ncbi:DNA-binding response OmpR family regulator [Arthrobacter sp. PvP102]|uniref:response regulator transcription factor n=1 Tax=unclassified Arthrobacter TaxID=235627 RepID=UPI001AE82AB4|nr:MULTISPECIES: response regulator transcription factor [unclassified Arthrobacter]MBP1233042.1 DNA-binding response OmpR family regulator [Arthrobacter sp. PvP103]MBP1238177.1 DNA-binding response OmpR family regulator [Arthrobacter sp. PvP102]
MVTRGMAVVVDGDGRSREALEELLVQSGFEVVAAASGAEGVAAVRKHDPVLVTVEVGLPDFDGIEASRRIRTFSHAYVVMVSALASEADALLGLEAGADDYLAKPFRPRELRARIAALLRRPRRHAMVEAAQCAAGHFVAKPYSAETPAAAASATPQPAAAASAAGVGWDFEHRGLALMDGTRTVSVDGRAVDLTRTQFDLLRALLQNRGAVLTRADLARYLRNEPAVPGSAVAARDERVLEVHMGNLRKRLGDSSRSPRWVQTVRGVGYRLTMQ